MRFPTIIPCVLAVVLCAACQRSDDKIQTYRVTKEPDQPMMPGMDSAPMAAPPSRDIHWSVPSGWVEQPASAMRVGSFLIKGDNGQTADVSVIPLSGPAGGDLANINRWRAQINLPPITEQDLPAATEHISPAGRAMELVNFVSTEPMIDNRYKKRLISVTYQQGEHTWFFKMLGEDATVRQARPAFMKFLESLRFSE